MKKKKIEFSKIVFLIITTIYSLTIGLSFVIIFNELPSEALAYIIPSITGLESIAVGYYYWKSKAENIVRFKRQYDVDLRNFMNESVGNEYE